MTDETLGPPLFLLRCGKLYGNERDEWDVEPNSGAAVDALADKHPGQTLGLYDEAAVRALLAAERERCAKLCDGISGGGPENGCCPTYWEESAEACAKAIRANT